MHDNMTGWVALVYLGISAWFWRDSWYLDSNARIAWAIAWPALAVLYAVLVVISAAGRLLDRLCRRMGE